MIINLNVQIKNIIFVANKRITNHKLVHNDAIRPF